MRKLWLRCGCNNFAFKSLTFAKLWKSKRTRWGLNKKGFMRWGITSFATTQSTARLLQNGTAFHVRLQFSPIFFLELFEVKLLKCIKRVA